MKYETVFINVNKKLLFKHHLNKEKYREFQSSFALLLTSKYLQPPTPPPPFLLK